jgi:hypothetical protein
MTNFKKIAEFFHADGRTGTHDDADSRFAQFCERSTAVVPAGLFGEVEHFGQPTAVTCNYERLAERNQKHRVQTDRWAVWGDSQ